MRITGIGAGFVVWIAAGLFLGVRMAAIRGESWWPIVGLFAGLVLGAVFAVCAFRQALH